MRFCSKNPLPYVAPITVPLSLPYRTQTHAHDLSSTHTTSLLLSSLSVPALLSLSTSLRLSSSSTRLSLSSPPQIQRARIINIPTTRPPLPHTSKRARPRCHNTHTSTAPHTPSKDNTHTPQIRVHTTRGGSRHLPAPLSLSLFSPRSIRHSSLTPHVFSFLLLPPRVIVSSASFLLPSLLHPTPSSIPPPVLLFCTDHTFAPKCLSLQRSSWLTLLHRDFSST